MSIAKGLGGSGFQVAAIACKSEYQKMNPMHHSFTYGSNLMAAVAGAKTIEIMQRSGFLENVTLVGNYIMSELKKFAEKYNFIGEIRGVGLMIGFEIIKQNKEPDVQMTKYILKQAFANGLILRSSRYGMGNTLKIRPPLNITLQETEKLCNLLDKTLQNIAINN